MKYTNYNISSSLWRWLTISLAGLNFLVWSPITTSFCDAAEPWAFSFQESASPIAEGIVDFHDHLFYFLILILVAVTWVMTLIVVDSLKKNSSGTPFTNTADGESSKGNRVAKVSLKDLNHGSVIEIIWTLTPAFILVLIAFPSFRLLYLMDEIVEPLITVKAVGHQWYWTYEYTDTLENSSSLESSATSSSVGQNNLNFESYMKSTDSLEAGELRLLETDNKVVLPIDTRIRIIATGADVIHSWAVPSLGVKVDAIPGRLNQVSLDINREGTFYGQCSELCGVNHGFMPIQIEAVKLENYVEWLLNSSIFMFGSNYPLLGKVIKTVKK